MDEYVHCTIHCTVHKTVKHTWTRNLLGWLNPDEPSMFVGEENRLGGDITAGCMSGVRARRFLAAEDDDEAAAATIAAATAAFSPGGGVGGGTSNGADWWGNDMG